MSIQGLIENTLPIRMKDLPIKEQKEILKQKIQYFNDLKELRERT